MPHPDIIFQPLNYLQINPGTKLPPLKDLAFQEPSDLRAILLVNSKSSEV